VHKRTSAAHPTAPPTWLSGYPIPLLPAAFFAGHPLLCNLRPAQRIGAVGGGADAVGAVGGGADVVGAVGGGADVVGAVGGGAGVVGAVGGGAGVVGAVGGGAGAVSAVCAQSAVSLQRAIGPPVLHCRAAGVQCRAAGAPRALTPDP
jgi:hypothetical protein